MSINVHDLNKIYLIVDHLKDFGISNEGKKKKKQLYVGDHFVTYRKIIVKKNSKYKIHWYFPINN